MAIEALDHVSVIVRDTEEALRFYCGVLLMDVMDNRPDFSFPGAWLRAGAGQIHLLELPNPDEGAQRPHHAGQDRHLALKVDDLANYQARLEAVGITYTRSRSGRAAIFCRDPDGNGIELIGNT